MKLKEMALPARSSRPSQGEGEICLQLCFKVGEVGFFYPPSCSVAEEERRSGEGDTVLARWGSTMRSE